MQVCTNVKRLCSSLQGMVGLRRRKDVKRPLQISHPFDFKKGTATLPGFDEGEMTVLREKAAASRLGVAEENPPSSRSTTPDYTHPRSAPAMPVRGPSRLSSGAVSLPIPCTSVHEDGPFLLAMSTSLPVSPMSSNSSSGFSRSRSGSGPSSGMPKDLGDFHLGSPVSPLTPRGSPRSVRSRMLA